MIISNISDFLKKIQTRQPLLGLDVGEKTIGLALSDTSHTIASAFKTLNRKKFSKDAEELVKIINEHNICGLVIGLPLNMNGTEGKKCQSVRQFASNLQKLIDIPITFYDERLTTHAAESILIEADMSREKRAEVIDKVAASYILQGLLNSRK